MTFLEWLSDKLKLNEDVDQSKRTFLKLSGGALAGGALAGGALVCALPNSVLHELEPYSALPLKELRL